MKRFYKKIAELFWRPFVRTYLRKNRHYTYNDVIVLVKKGVFYPGFFFSTRFILEWLEQEVLSEKKVLELGAGSGLISVVCARQGALVSASDINPDATEGIKHNAALNETSITVYESDLFDKIPTQLFDYIIINPPYYRGTAGNMEQQAWYAGAQLDYFQKLFSSIEPYFNTSSKVVMSLSEDCELDAIRAIAGKHNLKLELVKQKKIHWEENYLFQLKQV